jgi:hypothetical protein
MDKITVLTCPDQKPMIGISNKIPVPGCHNKRTQKISGYAAGYISCETMLPTCPRKKSNLIKEVVSAVKELDNLIDEADKWLYERCPTVTTPNTTPTRLYCYYRSPDNTCRIWYNRNKIYG